MGSAPASGLPSTTSQSTTGLIRGAHGEGTEMLADKTGHRKECMRREAGRFVPSHWLSSSVTSRSFMSVINCIAGTR